MVRDSVTGRPIARASVTLSRSAGDSYTTATDAEGAFRFEAIAPGDYGVATGARGYGNAASVSLAPGQFSSSLHCSAGQTITGTVVALDPPAIVSGRVTDVEGQPIRGATVDAFQRFDRELRPFGGAAADDRGEYRMTLWPGRYFLRATAGQDRIPRLFTDGPGKPEKIVESLFHSNAPEVSGATEFELHPGQQLGGVDFQLPTVVAYHVRGVLRPAPEVRASVSLLHRDGSWGNMIGAIGALVKDGAFDIAGVAPGRYRLRASGMNGEDISGETAVEVADRDLNGVVFQVIPPFSLQGVVRFEDTGPHDLTRVNLWITVMEAAFGRRHPARTANPKPDGSFRFEDLQAGEAVLQVASDDYYIESLSYNHRALSTGIVDLTSGAAGQLEVTLATGKGEIRGTVHWPDVLPGAAPPIQASNPMVVLAPAEPIHTAGFGNAARTGVRWANIDQEGRFAFPKLPPGRYFAWAVRDLGDPWYDPEFVSRMQSRATSVELPKGGSVQVEIREVME